MRSSDSQLESPAAGFYTCDIRSLFVSIKRLAVLSLLGMALLPTTSFAVRDKKEDKAVKVAVEFQGVSEAMRDSAQEVIDEQLSLSGDTAASPALADDLSFFLRRHYLDQGYEHA